VFIKGGRSCAPYFSLAGKTGNKDRGKTKIKGGVFKNVYEESKERVYLD
jgi:hypothetical protein